MTSSRITRQDKLLYVEAKLFFSLCDDPNVRLIAIVDWVWVWVLGAETIVHGEHRNAELERPFPRVVLMCTRVLAAESTSMKVDHCLIEPLPVILRGDGLPV